MFCRLDYIITYLELSVQQIGLVKFNSGASTPVEYDGDGRGCHGQRLADATPVNIKYLENYVDAIVAEGKDDHTFRSAN